MPRTAIALALALAGCSSAPRHDGHAPANFTLSVEVRGDGSGTRAPAWYMVEPDGRLRAALGERTPMSPVPPAVRSLTHAEVEGVWSLVVGAGLTAQEPPGRPASDAAPDARGTQPACVVYVADGPTRRTRMVTLDAADGPMDALLERLRGLAWIRAR